jgi:hypothetical protein
MYSSRDPIPGDRLALWWAFVGVHPGLGELELAADPRTQVAATDGTNCRLSVHLDLMDVQWAPHAATLPGMAR